MIKVLESAEEVGRAIAALRAEGWGYHFDAFKNWDLAQIASILRVFKSDASILDIGSSRSWGSVLRLCYKKGYTNLVGIDLSIPIEDRLVQLYLMMKSKAFRNPYRLMKMDATRTTFPDDTFDVITCVSVIEHGVKLESFLSEASRILKPHGYLFISTDYWEPKIASNDVRPFGLDWRIFCKEEIEALVQMAEKCHLRMANHEFPPTKERAVHWRGKSYTFISLVFEKRPAKVD